MNIFIVSGKLKRLNEDLIRRSHDQSVRYGARLFAFTESRTKSKDFSSDIGSVGDKLFHDDLLSFSISARRLVEATNHIVASQNIFIHTFKIQATEHFVNFVEFEDLSIWEVFNYVIHSTRIDLYYESVHILFDCGHYGEDDFFEAVSENLGHLFSPVIFAGTDRKSPKIISVLELVKAYDGLVESIVDFCGKNKIHISSLYEF